MTVSNSAPHTLQERVRPRWLTDMVGNEKMLKIVAQHLQDNSFPKAAFVYGRSGCGKTTLNAILTRALTCTSPDAAGKPCGACASCKSHSAGNHPDVLHVNCGADTGIADMRAAIAHARLYPSIGRNRIIFLDEIHGLSKAAETALLVILDAPPAHTVFLVGSMEPEKVSKALADRCFKMMVAPVPVLPLAKRLFALSRQAGTPISEGVAKQIAELEDGVPRAAVQLLDQVITGLKAGVEVDMTKPFEAIEKLTSSSTSPFELSKRLLAALYSNNGKGFVEALGEVTNPVFLLKTMINHNADAIRYDIAPKSVTGKALFGIRDVCAAAASAKLTITERGRVGRALEEALKLTASYDVNAVSALVHTSVLLASERK